MPHQNTSSSSAAAQNAATDPAEPNDQAREESRSVRPEPRSYAADSFKDASLAPPAAGEVAEYMNEGDPLDVPGAQSGRNHTKRPGRTEAARTQGPKTRAGNRRIVKTGRAD